MAFLRIPSLLLLALLHASLLLPAQILCANDKEANLLKGLNTYRTSAKLAIFTENKKAACLADEIADELDGMYKKCVPTTNDTAIPVTTANNKFSNFDKLLTKCNLDPKAPRDGVILPVCVPDLDETLVLTNYTHTAYSTYLNDSRYLRAGIGSEDDWMVVVLTKNLTEPATSAAIGGLDGVNWFMGIVSCLIALVSLGVCGFEY